MKSSCHFLFNHLGLLTPRILIYDDSILRLTWRFVTPAMRDHSSHCSHKPDCHSQIIPASCVSHDWQMCLVHLVRVTFSCRIFLNKNRWIIWKHFRKDVAEGNKVIAHVYDNICSLTELIKRALFSRNDDVDNNNNKLIWLWGSPNFLSIAYQGLFSRW
jgi:hypothetical protein